MQKGGMILIDEAKAEALYAAMGPAVQLSGGSAANTIAGLASRDGVEVVGMDAAAVSYPGFRDDLEDLVR